MEKLISCMALTIAILANVSAYASTTYDITDNSASTDNSGQNILISKGTALPTNADDIIYVDQAESGGTIAAATKFLLRDAPAEGTYTIRFGGGTAVDKSTFIIGIESDSVRNTQMTPIEGEDGMVRNEDGTYSLGFKGTTSIGKCKSIIVETTEGILGYTFDTVLQGDGDVTVGIQINNIPADKKDSIKAVYFSTTEIANDTAQ